MREKNIILCEFYSYEDMVKKKNFNRIKIVLAEQDRSQKWLAEKMDMRKPSISRWATNKSQPSIETLFEIAEVLKVDVRTLLVSSLDHEKDSAFEED